MPSLGEEKLAICNTKSYCIKNKAIWLEGYLLLVSSIARIKIKQMKKPGIVITFRNFVSGQVPSFQKCLPDSAFLFSSSVSKDLVKWLLVLPCLRSSCVGSYLQVSNRYIEEYLSWYSRDKGLVYSEYIEYIQELNMKYFKNMTSL